MVISIPEGPCPIDVAAYPGRGQVYACVGPAAVLVPATCPAGFLKTIAAYSHAWLHEVPYEPDYSEVFAFASDSQRAEFRNWLRCMSSEEALKMVGE